MAPLPDLVRVEPGSFFPALADTIWRENTRHLAAGERARQP
jgi:hypothetical protein